MVCPPAPLLPCSCLFKHFGESIIDTGPAGDAHIPEALTKNDNKVNKTWCDVTMHLLWLGLGGSGGAPLILKPERDGVQALGPEAVCVMAPQVKTNS